MWGIQVLRCRIQIMITRDRWINITSTAWTSQTHDIIIMVRSCCGWTPGRNRCVWRSTWWNILILINKYRSICRNWSKITKKNSIKMSTIFFIFKNINTYLQFCTEVLNSDIRLPAKSRSCIRFSNIAMDKCKFSCFISSRLFTISKTALVRCKSRLIQHHK